MHHFIYNAPHYVHDLILQMLTMYNPLLESWVMAFSLSSVKLAWKTATLLALVTAKYF